MKEEFYKLDQSLQDEMLSNEDLVVKNYNYLKSIGIFNPEMLLSVSPELFLLPNTIVKEKMNGIDIRIINEDPCMILELL